MSTPSLREQKRVILLVEDEPMLRASMARGLGRLSDVEVVEAGSVREAMRALEAIEPSLLLSDLDLPDGSGIEVAAMLDRKKLGAPVVFVSAYVGKYRAQLARRSDVEIYEKPVPLERLRTIVEKALEPRVTQAAPFGVPDYVQLAAMGRHSVVVEVRGAKVKGYIVIDNGEAFSAVDNLGKGTDAFRRLAFLKSASINCRALARGERYERNIEGSCESILLEAARVEDEESAVLDDEFDWETPHHANGGTAPPAKKATVPPAPDGRLQVRFDELYDEGIEALLKKDFRRAFAAFRSAGELIPDDPRVRANLVRLREMGYAT